MINIILYKHSKDFYQLDYSQFADCEKVILITPSPFHADTLRAKLSVNQNAHQYDVITMSKYLKDELVQLVDNDVLSNFKGKAELILYLSTAWKAVNVELNVGLFKKAFNLLTDLRSFSLSNQVIETALEEYDQDTAKTVKAFQMVMQHQNIIDEHQANYLLSERLRKGDLAPDYDSNRVLVFWGFDFLSAVQVDLLKSLGIRNQVVVPIVKDVFEKSQATDWIRWIAEQDTNILTLSDKEFAFNAQIKEFPSNYLSRALAKELEQNSECDIYLTTKTINITTLQEVNLTKHFYKVSTNLFTDSVSNFFENLKIYLESNQLVLKVSQLREWVDELIGQQIQLQDFRFLKVALLFKKNLIEWFELSTYNEHFTLFDLYIFKEVMLLNLPRVSLIPNAKKMKGKVSSLKELAAFDPLKKNILCVTANYGPIKSSSSKYTEKVEAYLTSIGPIRRAELEFEILKHRLLELFELENTTVFIENGIIEHDVGWSSILAKYSAEIKRAPINEIESIKKDFVKCEPIDLKRISATRLQSYLDCPRKYYLNYVANLNPNIQIPGVLDVLKLGEIEHAVIEKYLKFHIEFNEQIFIEIIKECLDFILQKYELTLPKEVIETHLIEIRSLCSSIIKNLIEINKSLGLNLSFEHGIIIEDPIHYSGSIDLYAFNDNMQLILDFKRGSGSIPSQKGLLEFEKIQLWFYLQRLTELKVLDLSKEIVFGYINLSKPEDSLLICTHEITRSILKETNLDIFKKASVLKIPLTQMISEYKILEDTTIELLNNEKAYHPMPKQAKVCNFCALNNICSRDNSYE